MPWLYLLALSIVILIVWWALGRSAETPATPGADQTENVLKAEATPEDEDGLQEPVK